nr:hypothetical protein GCM10020093_097080 [Planobispora longispora]
MGGRAGAGRGRLRGTRGGAAGRLPEEAACGTEDFDWAGIYCGGEAVVNVLVEGGPDDGSGDGSDDGSDDGSGDGEVFPVMFTLAHEYAHHVQAIVGISAQDGSEVFDEAWSRRLELQADCLAAAALRDVQPYLLNDLRRSLAHGTETDATEEDAAEQRASHGSSRSGALWMLRGQREGTVGACNTWKAPEGRSPSAEGKSPRRPWLPGFSPILRRQMLIWRQNIRRTLCKS